MRGIYPLTHPQLGRWYAEKIFPGTSIGNVGGMLLLKGELDFELLQKAINIFIEQNDGCRIRIKEVEDEPKQYLSEHFPRSFDYIDFSDSIDPEEADKWCDQQMRTPLPLIECDLFYFALVRISPTEGGFFGKFHHLISDAWSMTLLGTQVVEHYTALVKGIEISTESKPSYLDWVKTEEEYLHSKRFEKSRHFWNEQFKDLPEPTTLKPRAEIVLNTDAHRKTFELTEQQTAALQQYCLNESCSMLGTILSALSVYINRVTGQDDMVIATMSLNRTSLREKNIVGMFAGTVPVRIAIDDNLNFKHLVKEIQKKLMSVIRHQSYPYDILLEDVRAKHKTNRVLHNIVFSYQNAKFAKKDGVEDFKHSWIFNGHIADSLIVNVNDREGEGRLIIDYDYQSELFTEDEISSLHHNIIAIISDAIQNPGHCIKDLQSLNTKDLQRLRGEYLEQKALTHIPNKET